MVVTNQGGKKMLNKKIAVVTGGGSGMGRSAALELARNGAEVFILGRTEEKLIDTLRLAEMENLSLYYKVCDVSNMEAVTLFFNELTIKEICPDIIVNCAGVINIKKDDGSFDNDIIFRVNILGMMNVCDIAIQNMILRKKQGTIINIASIAGHDGSSDFPSYAASKGAVLSYTKSLAMKYGKNGIRINSISPGVIVTPMSYIETPNFDDYIPELIQMHPLRRLGKPEDIAKTILFFASDLSEFITGQDIVVDGGYTLRE